MSISNGYATLAQVKSALRISDTIDDSILEMAITSASRLIDGYANRIFYNAGTATRVYASYSSYVSDIDDVISVSEIATSSTSNWDTVWSTADYQLEPLNGLVDGIPVPYNRIRAIGSQVFSDTTGEANVRVTGTWGFSSVPTVISQACVLQASRIYKRNDSPLGVAGFGDLGAYRVSSRLDPDVAQLVEPYRIIRAA
jgi:hypothetical protein